MNDLLEGVKRLECNQRDFISLSLIFRNRIHTQSLTHYTNIQAFKIQEYSFIICVSCRRLLVDDRCLRRRCPHSSTTSSVDERRRFVVAYSLLHRLPVCTGNGVRNEKATTEWRRRMDINTGVYLSTKCSPQDKLKSNGDILF